MDRRSFLASIFALVAAPQAMGATQNEDTRALPNAALRLENIDPKLLQALLLRDLEQAHIPIPKKYFPFQDHRIAYPTADDNSVYGETEKGDELDSWLINFKTFFP